MSKTFYASGFLYNLKTQQILLIKSNDDVSPLWSMLGGEGDEGEDALEIFQKTINKLLNLDVKPKHIYPIYDYYHTTLEKPNFVFYVEVRKKVAMDVHPDGTLAWVHFHETPKLKFTDHTKQDVMVGKRVIDAKQREEDNQDEISALGA